MKGHLPSPQCAVKQLKRLFKERRFLSSAQRCTDGGRREASRPPIFSNLQESWSQVSQAATRWLATVFSVTVVFLFSNNLATIVGQLVRTSPPPNRRCLSTSLLQLSLLRAWKAFFSFRKLSLSKHIFKSFLLFYFITNQD